MAGFLTPGCGPSVNVEQERAALMTLDNEWSASVADIDKFTSYYAPDASIYPPGMPVATGTAAIKETFTQMASAPGFALEFSPTKADVSASGDVGYTAGTYKSTMSGTSESGKYVTIWKKQPDGQWKVTEDIFNADSGPAPVTHTMVAPAAIAWGDGPPSLPPGAKMAVISGDPTKAGPFVLRAQVPAGYKVPPHWHPTAENLTILSGTIALGMADTWDDSKLESVGTGGFVAIPGSMHHFFFARTAATFQVHGMGPFAINYINPADDPRKK
jgi:ketosteroid isomerase-like protein